MTCRKNFTCFKNFTANVYRFFTVNATAEDAVAVITLDNVDVIVPDSYMGDVMGDMSKRRGRILGTNSVAGKTVVSAEAPQAELAKYATDLRSMTQGRGKFTLAFERYEEVPGMQAAKIIEDYKKRLAAAEK